MGKQIDHDDGSARAGFSAVTGFRTPTYRRCHPARLGTHRRRIPNRRVMDAILLVLSTGMQMKHLEHHSTRVSKTRNGPSDV